MPYAVAAGISAVGAIGGAIIGGDAAKSAAQTQANAANNATAFEKYMYDQTQKNLAPYMGSGTNALAALNFGLGLGPNTGGGVGSGAYGSLTAPFTAADYTKSPGYAFQFGEGVNAVDNSASRAGGIGGGNTLRALTTFGQGLANTDYQQAFQNYIQQQQQRYGMLSNTANSGQNAAAGLGGIATQVGGQVGSNIIGAGNALAAGQIGSANAIGGGLNSLAQLSFLYGSGGMPGGGGGAPTINNPYSGVGTEGFQNTFYPSQGLLPQYCDYGLKKNIEPMYFRGTIPLYAFHYKYEDDADRKHVGHMAQDVERVYPDAVSRGPRGYLMIDYAKLPEEDWRALEALAVAAGDEK
jgi:hypothetical protein